MKSSLGFRSSPFLVVFSLLSSGLHGQAANSSAPSTANSGTLKVEDALRYVSLRLNWQNVTDADYRDRRGYIVQPSTLQFTAEVRF